MDGDTYFHVQKCVILFYLADLVFNLLRCSVSSFLFFLLFYSGCVFVLRSSPAASRLHLRVPCIFLLISQFMSNVVLNTTGVLACLASQRSQLALVLNRNNILLFYKPQIPHLSPKKSRLKYLYAILISPLGVVPTCTSSAAFSLLYC